MNPHSFKNAEVVLVSLVTILALGAITLGVASLSSCGSDIGLFHSISSLGPYGGWGFSASGGVVLLTATAYLIERFRAFLDSKVVIEKAVAVRQSILLATPWDLEVDEFLKGHQDVLDRNFAQFVRDYRGLSGDGVVGPHKFVCIGIGGKVLILKEECVSGSRTVWVYPDEEGEDGPSIVLAYLSDTGGIMYPAAERVRTVVNGPDQ